MARYTEAVCRLCRREGVKLYLKGERCFTPKCGIERRSYAPGQHGQTQTRRKTSQYGLQLREKQKLRRMYGVSEQQFRRYFTQAEGLKGVTGDNFIKLLERRLDNVVFRLGFAASRSQSRQLVGHGHFLVNGRKLDVPSYVVRPGDTVALKEGSRPMAAVQASLESAKHRTMPSWLELDAETFTGQVKAVPSREDIDTQINEQLIVEFYSK